MERIITLSCTDLNGTVPVAIQVIPGGAHSTPKGDFVCDAESVRIILADFETRTNDMVIDYEHQTLQDVQAPAAGWVKGKIGLEDRGEDGLWATVEWTDKAREYIANREYRYVSPVFAMRKSDGRVLSLINVALTNQPNIDGMVPLINKRTGLSGEESMLKKTLCNKLGLAETASDQEVIDAVGKLCGDSAKACKLAVDLGLTAAATESELTAVILAMKQGETNGATLAGKVTALEQQLARRDADEVIVQAMKDGKITPAQKEWAQGYAAKDLEGFKLFVAKAPAVVPVGDLGSGAPEQHAEIDAVTLANKAVAYQHECRGSGRIITMTEAVNHVKGVK